MVEPFLIANMEIGLERDREPWLLPDQAFPTLEDAYLFRGRIKRRLGFENLGRLAQQATADDFGARSSTPEQFTGPLTVGAALQVQPGSVSITDGVTTFIDDGEGTMVVSGGTGTGGPIDYFTGVFDVTFTIGGATNVIATFSVFYGRPVMGLPTRELSVINQEQLIAFDTVKANRFSTSLDIFVDISFYKTSGTAFSWTGTDSDFFWTYNYANAFWATNNVRGFQGTVDASAGSGDGIRWYDGTGWINFLPPVDASNYLMGARIIVSYRNRLVMLNTTEGSAYGTFNNFPQRARWCQNGTPYYDSTVPAGFSGGSDASAWDSDVVGKGGFIDAPTSEQIISAAFINDELVVYFERSTWKLSYYGSPVLPFVWERVNVELGAESTFSTIPFDKGLIGVGNYGIVISNGNEISRIDQKIPDEVFQIHNGNDGVKRVYGIRDFTRQLVYWTFPDEDSNPTFPTRVLVYDYLLGTYAIFNDSLTCFGQYQPIDDVTWSQLKYSWRSQPIPWNSGQLQSDYPLIVAGNQQGFVFKNYNSGPVINDPSLYITDITQALPAVVTSANHNLQAGTIIALSEVEGMTEVNDQIYRVAASPTANTFSLETLVGDNWIQVDSNSFGAYTQNGLIQVRNNIHILTKKFNPYINTGNQVRIQEVDYFIEFSAGLEFTTEIYLDENNNESVESIVILPDTNVLSKVWYPAFYSAIGQFAQIEITFSDSQMVDVDKSSGDITIHAFLLMMEKCGRLTYGMLV